MKMGMRNLLLLVVFGALLSGCAVGNTYRYDLGDADLSVNSKNTVAVSVVDVRPYVLDGDKTPQFVGLQRAGFGNPWDVTTESTRPLSEDLTNSLVAALERAGNSVVGVPSVPKSTVPDARQFLLKASADRFALLTVREWKSDTYSTTGLSFDLILEVLDKDGVELAKTTTNGKDNLGSALVPKDARIASETAIRLKLETMFNEPTIKAALE